jgi:glyoxylase-like metal-dependent hydrolase (beta-lactamase superfamily II)
MLSVRDHGAVRQLEMSSRASRLAGYKVSAFLHRGILIDTGFPRARADLARWLDQNPVSGAIVTHWHEDHAGNAPLLLERGVPLTIGEATLARIVDPKPVPPYRRVVWGPPRPLGGAPKPATHGFRLIPTPGHSDDHLAVFDPEDGTVFLGDLFLGVKAAAVHPTEDPRVMVESLRRVLALQPARVFDAHRGLLDDAPGLLGAKIRWLEAAIERIEGLARRGESPAAIRQAVLGPEAGIAWFSGGEMSKANFVRSVLAGADPPLG